MASAPTASNQQQPFLLNGSDQFGVSREVLKVYYPADQATEVGSCYLIGPEHVELIERAAEQGFREYRQTSPGQRMEILNKLSNLLEQHQNALARLITLESGKPITLAQQEVQRAIGLCQDYAQHIRHSADQLYYFHGREARIGLFPLGPVLAITPFNFPLNLIVHKLAPAIAAGCSITIKPDLKTPLTALYLGRLAIEAGYQAISVVPAQNELAEALVKSSAFAKLSFTGSDQVGWYLKSIAGKKSVTLELGGNAAVVVEDLSMPVETMAERCAFGAFSYAGQVCISIQRILINARLLDEFIPSFLEATRALKVGDPMKPETMIGPMITIEDVQRTRNLIKNAIFNGANVRYGGNTYNMFTMNPTVLDRTTPEMDVNSCECFAPIVTLTAYDEFEQALHLVNQSRYGLQAGVFVAEADKMQQAYRTLEVGGVLINEIPTFRSDFLPYGGVKDSGLGREGVLSGIREYSYEKTLLTPL